MWYRWLIQIQSYPNAKGVNKEVQEKQNCVTKPDSWYLRFVKNLAGYSYTLPSSQFIINFMISWFEVSFNQASMNGLGKQLL